MVMQWFSNRRWQAAVLVLVLVGALIQGIPGVRAADSPLDNPSLWQPRTGSIAVFKNGLAFVSQEGSVELQEGWCYARDIPPAAFGTLAIYATDPDQVVDVVGAGDGELIEFDGQHVPDDPESKQARLEANLGFRVRLDYQRNGDDRQGEMRHEEGKLVSVIEGFAILDTAKQTVAVPLDGVRRMQLRDLPLRVHVSQSDGSDADEATLGIAYLRKGMMWIPEYTLKVIDEETAELTLRGTLVNEAEDLVHCDVNFVVGVPHFVHSDLMSPVVVGRTLRSIGAGLPRDDVPPQLMSQMMNRAVVANNSRVSPRAVDADGESGDSADGAAAVQQLMGNLPVLESPGSGDYTVYTRDDLTVRRGERSIVTLFTQQVRYRHRYRWDTTDAIEHELVLDNETPTAWTTGPCLTLSGNQPLSEDVLAYTPVGSSGQVQVTTAINVAHSVKERETDRELKAHEPRHNEFYDLVTIGGTIRIKSYEERPVELAITAPIDGRPTDADQEGEISIDATRLRLLDRGGRIKWEPTLEPQQSLTLEYEYERYVPSN